MHNMIQMESFAGAASAELAQGDFIQELAQSYRHSLERNGVVFPAPEVEQTIRLWDAQAKIDRGADALQSDGSPIDLSNFDRETANDLILANRKPLDNAEKLESLTRLGLLSKAGSLLLARALDREGRGSQPATSARQVVALYKQFVQLSMATEGWDRQWNEVVSNDFEGPAVPFPLDGQGVRNGLKIVFDPFFAGVAGEHFPGVQLRAFNLFSRLSEAGGSYNERFGKLAAQAGLFYRHSPEGCQELITQLIAADSLPAISNWHQLVQDASAAVPESSI